MYEELKNIYPEKPLHRAQDLSGQIFGKWKVLYRTNNLGNKTMWLCECSCDKHTIKPIATKSLNSGTSTSCGCDRKRRCNNTKDKKKRIRDDNGNIICRKCAACQRMLPMSKFYKSGYSYDGYSSQCKECSYKTKSNRYNIYRKNAKKKKRSFTITKEQFISITSKPCYYCGGYMKEDLLGEKYNGIDRVDSKKGYDIDNVVSCCEMCNRMKLDYNNNLFLNQIRKIYLYQNTEKESA